MIEPQNLNPYTLELVDYKIVKLGEALPPHSSSIFEYLIGNNGIFMAAFFSGADDADEGGFRIFAVLGRVTEASAEIICRVGVYRQFWHVPAAWICELPSFITDVTEKEKERSICKFYSNSVAPLLLNKPMEL